MTAPKAIQKHFNAFKGKDLRSSDLVRDPDAAIELRNAQYTRDSAIGNRLGAKILGPNAQFLGQFTHRYSDGTTGAIQEEMLSVGQKLYKRISNSITVTYSGSANPVQLNLNFASQSHFYCNIVEGTTTVLNYDMGNGLEAVPITLANLKTQIDAIPNFACTIVGTTTTPAALVLPTSLNLDLASSPKTQVITWYDWSAVNETETNTFGSYYGARGDTAFEHCCMVNANNCAYFATGYEYVKKYDGQTVYRMGVPEPPISTMALGGAGVPNGTYYYYTTYVQIDNRGNRQEGTESVVSASVAPVNQIVNVTVTNVQAGTGFNTNCALVNGNQVGVTTVTVTNSPHTLQVGDTAYFLDRASGNYVTRVLTGRTATTITFAGAVNVNNADVISNNLRIAIYRTKAGGIEPFLVAEIPNNSFAGTQVYADNKADSALGGQYYFPLPGYEHDLLNVKPRYLTIHQSQMIAAGAFASPDTIYVSLVGDPEYVPAVAGQSDIISTRSGGVSGLASDQTSLIVGKDTELFVGTGDFSTPGAYRFQRINQKVGITCHNSIAEIGDGIAFLSNSGFYVLIGGSRLVELGEPINKVFFDPVYSDATRQQLKRSWAVYVPQSEQYICYIPTESGSGTGRYANSNAITYIYDTYFEGWMDWDTFNMGGGACVFGNELWFQSKRTDTTLGVTGNLWKQSKQGNVYDYADHGEPISFRFIPQWEDLGEPSVWKLIPRLKIYSLVRDVLQPAFSMTVKSEIDYAPGITHSNFTATFGSGASLGYGYGAWGSSPWGTPVIVSQKYKLKVTKLKTLRFRFEHANLHEKMAISGWEYEVSPTYSKELK